MSPETPIPSSFTCPQPPGTIPHIPGGYRTGPTAGHQLLKAWKIVFFNPKIYKMLWFGWPETLIIVTKILGRMFFLFQYLHRGFLEKLITMTQMYWESYPSLEMSCHFLGYPDWNPQFHSHLCPLEGKGLHTTAQGLQIWSYLLLDCMSPNLVGCLKVMK